MDIILGIEWCWAPANKLPSLPHPRLDRLGSLSSASVIILNDMHSSHFLAPYINGLIVLGPQPSPSDLSTPSFIVWYAWHVLIALASLCSDRRAHSSDKHISLVYTYFWVLRTKSASFLVLHFVIWF